MKHQCPLETCDYEAENSHAFAGHISGHTKRGEMVKGQVKAAQVKTQVKPEPLAETETLPTPAQIADALLTQVLFFLNEKEYMKNEVLQLKSAIRNQNEMEKELADCKAELQRVVKLHNEQVKRGSFTSSEELLRLAKIKR